MAAFWSGNLPVLLGLGVALSAVVGRVRRHVPLLSAAVIFGVGLFTVTARANLPAFAAAAVSHCQLVRRARPCRRRAIAPATERRAPDERRRRDRQRRRATRVRREPEPQCAHCGLPVPAARLEPPSERTVLLRRLPLASSPSCTARGSQTTTRSEIRTTPNRGAPQRSQRQVRGARRARLPRESLPSRRGRRAAQRVLRRRRALFSLRLAARAAPARHARGARSALRLDAFRAADHLGSGVGSAQ